MENQNEEWVFGRHPVHELLKSGRAVNALYMGENVNPRPLSRLLDLAKEQGIPVKKVKKSKLDQLADGANHQGIVASGAAYAYSSVDAILARAEDKGEPLFLIVLDEIEDPHNLGSIIRSADAMGAHGVVIPKRRAVGLTSTVAKTAAGALEYVPVARVTNIANTLRELKKDFVQVIGTDAKGSITLRDAPLQDALALVIGSEGKGVRPSIAKLCDTMVNIPMCGHVNSFNASVATGICLYEVFTSRQKRN